MPAIINSLATTSMQNVFNTDFGWCGISADKTGMQATVLGYPSRTAALTGLANSLQQRQSRNTCGRPTPSHFVDDPDHDEGEVADWLPELQSRFQRYAAGKTVHFGDVPLSQPPGTEFQQAIRAACQELQYGQTVTYGELAARAGFPRAARAVGSVMSGNCMPLLVPCHRVIASGGKLGGFTSPQGVSLKQHLLSLEAGR